MDGVLCQFLSPVSQALNNVYLQTHPGQSPGLLTYVLNTLTVTEV
jgi:hypothetical protein